MHGYMRMCKRKLEIFTVAESVVNWFEASNHSLIPNESTNEIAHRTKTGGEGLVQPNTTDVAANGPGITNWPKAVEETKPPAEVVVPAGTTVGRGTKSPSTTEVDEQEGPARQAFWALLHAVGYDCW